MLNRSVTSLVEHIKLIGYRDRSGGMMKLRSILCCGEKWSARSVCVFLIVLCGFTLIGLISAQLSYASGAKINCDPHTGSCIQTIGDVTVEMEISPRPVKALEDLLFKISLSGSESAKATQIDLGMPAMKMGPNRVMLKSTGPGKFEGRGVIVKCKSGHLTWYAIVSIPDHGEAIFVFDVIY